MTEKVVSIKIKPGSDKNRFNTLFYTTISRYQEVPNKHDHYCNIEF